MKLYDRLYKLPVPSFSGQRMKLPCLCFTLGPVSVTRGTSGHVFHAKMVALGTVEISSLVLVHPWIDFLLDRQHIVFLDSELPSFPTPSNFTSATPQSRTAWLASRFGLPFNSPLQVVARLRKPFGALFTPTRHNVAEYRRVASESLITVRVQNVFVASAQILDVL
ncbi:hypothetical protein EV363DRAFT_1398440 [Boletus edulis]|nr:hypothetical protein EV363DRAFT_1398440 [Boletus edulis]